MEIKLKAKECPTEKGFKIDLIVWKFCNVSPATNPLFWFKIDLIVWK